MYGEAPVEADGGSLDLHLDGRRNTVYYWFDPETSGVLYHTSLNDDRAHPFFPSVGEAETFLEQQAESGNSDRYSSFSLYEAKIQKVEDAVEVLMDQAGIDDYW